MLLTLDQLDFLGGYSFIFALGDAVAEEDDDGRIAAFPAQRKLRHCILARASARAAVRREGVDAP